ncbi:MAG: hypothetical protein QG673_1539 [Pseudomonadota bacterium]|jgi:hypothetical protein|nr:hypothetical protein [Pseudomonadota bacterium]
MKTVKLKSISTRLSFFSIITGCIISLFSKPVLAYPLNFESQTIAKNSLTQNPAQVNTSNDETDRFHLFQKFINQYSIGYQFIGINFSNVGNANAQDLNINVTKLFDMGIYIEANYDTFTYFSQFLQHHPDGSPSLDRYGDYPKFNGLNLKVGYALRPIPEHLYVIPYATGGYNSQWATYTVDVNAQQTANLTQNYFLTFGGGVKLAYRINSWINTYIDTSVVQNQSQAPALTYGASLTNYAFNTQIGTKIHLYDQLQCGLHAFYMPLYYPDSPANTPAKVAVTSYIYGAMFSLGLNY